MCLDLRLQELEEAISSIPSPRTSQTPSQQNNVQCSTSLHAQSNTITPWTKESVFLRSLHLVIEFPASAWALPSAGLLRLLFISTSLGSRQFLSPTQLPSFMKLTEIQYLWNSFSSEKHVWNRSFGWNMPQSNRGHWQTQRQRDQLGVIFLRSQPKWMKGANAREQDDT